MCSKRLTQSPLAHQEVVRTFGGPVFYCNKQGLTHISHIPSYSAILDGIAYDMNQYITTGLLPFEEFSEHQPRTDEKEWRALSSVTRYEV